MKQYIGSCDVSNGIALSSIRHKALDRGVITINSDLKVQFSPAVRMVERLIWDFESERISLPRNFSSNLSENVLEWHLREVFEYFSTHCFLILV
nr:hypothetical protein [Photobacterium leiognathi]